MGPLEDLAGERENECMGIPLLEGSWGFISECRLSHL